jgi:hypothetical protein
MSFVMTGKDWNTQTTKKNPSATLFTTNHTRTGPELNPGLFDKMPTNKHLCRDTDRAEEKQKEKKQPSACILRHNNAVHFISVCVCVCVCVRVQTPLSALAEWSC